MAQNCAAFGCQEPLLDTEVERAERYCTKCRLDFSIKALDLMRNFQCGVKELLIRAARLFTTAQGVADYLGVSLPTLYSWIERYHGLSFRQFRRRFICSASGHKCVVVDHNSAGYQWKYTIKDRIAREANACLCFVENAQGLLMTTLSVDQLSSTLRADIAYEPETGLHHLRYPIRLPQYRGGGCGNADDGDDDGDGG